MDCNRFIGFTKCSFFVALMMFAVNMASAGDYEIYKYIPKSQFSVNASVILKDDQWDAEQIQGIAALNVKRTCYVRLVYGKELKTDVATATPWILKVDYDIYSIHAYNNYLEDSRSLTINSVDNPLSINGHEYVSQGVKVVIKGIYATNQQTGVSMALASIPNDVRLEVGIKVEKYSEYDESQNTVLYTQKSGDNIFLSWKYLPWAEEYDVEWVFIDAMDEQYQPLYPNMLKDGMSPFEYKQPVRITTSNNFYNIEPVYPEGRLYFRVRGVGRFVANATEFVHRKYGAWNTNIEAGYPAYIDIQGFEDAKTWQIVKNYSSEGKSKTSLTYFDETSRSRQGISSLSDQNLVLVTENKYDYEGRPTVSFLPAPVSKTYMTNLGLHYREDFHKTASGDKFDRQHFEQHKINNPITAISSLSGASKYYSVNNDLDFVNKQLTPDAEGYVYTQTKFLNDDRQKVERKGGVGDANKIFSNDVVTFYGNPSSTVLHKLFGSNVGNARHYTKQAIKDANGQISVSYMDMSGIVIATSLVGTSPDNLIALSSNSGGAEITEHLMDNNVVNEEANTSIIDKALLNLVPGTTYNFTYEASTLSEVSSNCFDCKFLLQFKIVAPNGDFLTFNSASADRYTSTLPSGFSFNATTGNIEYTIEPNACATPSVTTNISFDAIFQQIGSYRVSKVLTLIPKEISDFQNIPVVINGETYTHDEFINSQLENVNLSGCDVTCEDHCKREFLDIPEPDQTGYDNCVKECKQLTTDKLEGAVTEAVQSECDGLLKAMIDQIKLDSDPDPLNDAQDGIYAHNSAFIEMAIDLWDGIEEGDPGYELKGENPPSGEELFGDDYKTIDDWNQDWLKIIVQAHPEYCHYTACKALEASKKYDLMLTLIPDWPTAASYGGGNYQTKTDLIGNDPVQVLLGGTTALNTKWDDYANDGTGTLVSLAEYTDPNWDITTSAQETLILGNISPLTWLQHFESDNYLYLKTSAESLDSRRWKFYRSFYQAFKQDLIDQVYIAGNVCSTNGYEPETNLDLEDGYLNTPTAVVYNPANLDDEADNIGPTTDAFCEAKGDQMATVWAARLAERCTTLYNGLSSGDLATFKTKLKAYAYQQCLNNTVPQYYPNPMVLTADMLTDANLSDALALLGINSSNIEASCILTLSADDEISKDNFVDEWELRIRQQCPALTQAQLNNIRTYLEDYYDDHFNVFTSVEINQYYFELEKNNSGSKLKQLNDYLVGAGCALLESAVTGSAGCLSYAPSADISALMAFVNEYVVDDVPNQMQATTSYGSFNGYPLNSTTSHILRATIGSDAAVQIAAHSDEETGTYNNIINIRETDGDLLCSYKIFFVYGDDKRVCELGDAVRIGGVAYEQQPAAGVDPGSGYTFANAVVDVYFIDDETGVEYVLKGYIYNSSSCFDVLICHNTIESWQLHCIKFMYDQARYNAEQIWQDHLNQQIAEHIQEATDKCNDNFQQNEDFYVSHIDNEYHFTLYYRDQAGNLVATVPPKGVKNTGVTFNAKGEYISGEPPHVLVNTFKFNALQQPIFQHTADGGDVNYWYDKKGQLRFSQNEDQFADFKHSFLKYDNLGRVIEAGEYEENLHLNPGLFINLYLEDKDFPDANNLGTDILNDYKRTIYDVGIGSQTNTRGRVASVIAWHRIGTMSPSPVVTSTNYNYDVTGYVKSLEQNQIFVINNNVSLFKKVDYEYDLISGKPQKVWYQKGQTDQFIHRYEYDAENKLTNAYTSADNVIYEEDAEYFFGPLSTLTRAEYGEDKVQGLDYMYTLQGWGKGVNMPGAAEEKDPGRDGYHSIASPSLNRYTGRDEMAYMLGFYEGDYKPIGGMGLFSSAMYDPYNMGAGAMVKTGLGTTVKGLFNGNITYMATELPKLATALATTDPLSLNVYQYDQLNRLKQSVSHGFASGAWSNRNDFKETFEYDPNGNITAAQRWDGHSSAHPTSNKIDDLTYSYMGDVDNRLYHVNDAVINSSLVGYDVDDQGNLAGDFSNANYTYYENGNLKSDLAEEIAEIKWNPSGKVTEVIRTEGSTKKNLKFYYDAMGNRIAKADYNSSDAASPLNWHYTRYVHEAGNNMAAIYDMNGSKPALGSLLNSTEYPMYGSSRLGNKSVPGLLLQSAEDIGQYKRIQLQKGYELNNHLGNVLATINDRKRGYETGMQDGIAEYYMADVATVSDYYAFGMQNMQRQYQSNTYRYGFNGKERDEEMKGEGNSYDFGARIYDSRLGRFLSVDPKSNDFPYYSPYLFAANCPIRLIDVNGEGPGDVLKGFSAAMTDYASLGLTDFRNWVEVSPADAEDFNEGLRLADQVMIAIATMEMTGGGGMTGTGLVVMGGGVYSLSIPGAGVIIFGVSETGGLALTAVGVVVGSHGAKMLHMAQKNQRKDNGIRKTELDIEQGSYTNTHQSGKRYHGKGTKTRMNESAKEKAEKYDDPVVDQDWTPAKNDREAFKQESRRLDTDKVGNIPGHKNPNNYNKRNSPGSKYRKQDGD